MQFLSGKENYFQCFIIIIIIITVIYVFRD